MTGDRRADIRFLLHLPVEITGVNDSGLQFVEQSQIVDAGEMGCCFSMRNAVQQGAILGIEPLGPHSENLEDEYPRLFVIIWTEREGDRQMVGARCLLVDEFTDSCSSTDLSSSNDPGKGSDGRISK